MNETTVFNALKYRTYDSDLGAYVWRNIAGQINRNDGPAVEYDHGTREWYQNNQLHRTDGPAVIYDNGDKTWYQNGQLHRTDGPAFETSEGHKEWFIHGEELTEDEFNKLSVTTLA